MPEKERSLIAVVPDSPPVPAPALPDPPAPPPPVTAISAFRAPTVGVYVPLDAKTTSFRTDQGHTHPVPPTSGLEVLFSTVFSQKSVLSAAERTIAPIG
jgi:hypothetical protein